MPKFKLESILQHRKHLEEIFQRAMADTLQALAAEKKSLGRLKANRAHIQHDLEQKLKNDINATEMRHFHKYLDRLALDIKEQRARVAEAEQKLEQKRLALTEAVKSRKIMDKLKDKQLAADVERLQKHEQSFMNEVAIGRHLRSRH